MSFIEAEPIKGYWYFLLKLTNASDALFFFYYPTCSFHTKTVCLRLTFQPASHSLGSEGARETICGCHGDREIHWQQFQQFAHQNEGALLA